MYHKIAILGVTIAFTTASTLTVVLRLFTRFMIVRKPGWDDAAIVAAMALWVSIPFYNITLSLTKLSLILLYMRLFALANRRFRLLLIAFLVFVVVEGLWFLFSALFICNPIRGFWDRTVPATCLSYSVIWCLNAALQIASDAVVVTTPIPTLARLRLPRRQKIEMIVVFALGFFVCALSIIRLTTIIKLTHSEDFTEQNGPAATWSSIESNVAIICACLPPLHPLLSRISFKYVRGHGREREREHDSARQHTVEKPPPSSLTWNLENPFAMTSWNYSASVTGNCSTLRDEVPETNSIQVVRELRWDLEEGREDRAGS
ncbi:uncharacterized protein ACLA_036660 [Aspergillus clavatus NRRL 1]|uniref:Rhodopsin domain-containing protein n=1 Tax=Aspergillus clavatus (strain ATCC 1007 / CBS 513.65 / DSM 816 / NCTC 3887 / NRRL 1 / QM 1276 / 107) TaxID=344612 RepID=A1CJY7_ASPCL|nr:uncharacterized protein ACLA_036660 [Aspergillus clavatus NRRL 1]EAW09461.1 hypothetical protein ACLA_036660 [Aspergillus clavatus NRRL 1]